MPEPVFPETALQPAAVTDDLPAVKAALAAEDVPVAEDLPAAGEELPPVSEDPPAYADELRADIDEVPAIAEDLPAYAEDLRADVGEFRPVAGELPAGPAAELAPEPEPDAPEAVTAEAIENTEVVDDLGAGVQPGVQPALD
jgi:hypothetical protein